MHRHAVARMGHQTLLLAVLGFSGQALASNLLFLSNSVISDLTEHDSEAFRAAIHHALDTVADRDKAIWLSDSKEIKASIQPRATYQRGAEQQTCRQTRFRLARNEHTVERYQFDFCETDQGWNIAHTPASSFGREDWNLLEQTLNRTLEDNENGEAASWTNHRTHSSGVLVPISQEMHSGKACRQTSVTIFNKEGQSSNGSYLFCRDAAGGWQRLVD